jgi:hypothetical protein
LAGGAEVEPTVPSEGITDLVRHDGSVGYVGYPDRRNNCDPIGRSRGFCAIMTRRERQDRGLLALNSGEGHVAKE